MWSRDVRATTAGILLIVATAAALTASALLGSSLDGSDFLDAIAQHQGQMLTASLFQFISAFTSAAIAISFYPVLRRHAEGMALGSVGFRIIEGVFYAVSAVGTLVLVAIAEQAAALDAGTRASGELVRDLREGVGVAGVLAFYIGGTLYYLVFYRSRLIPRWLSGWGLVGTGLGFVAAMLVLFRVVDTMSATQVALNAPIGVQELVLAGWLIWKGFRRLPAVATAADRSDSVVHAHA
jgi:hypothetical protein